MSELPPCCCCCLSSTQGPEIRTGMLENGKPVQLTSGQEVTITTDYAKPGNSGLIAMRCVCSSSSCCREGMMQGCFAAG